MNVTFEFASKKMITFSIYEACGGNFLPYGEIELCGTKGTIYAGQDGYRLKSAKKGQFQTWDKLVDDEEFNIPVENLPDGSNAFATATLIRNFLDCVKTREMPICPLEEGHRSTSFAHLANIAMATGKRLMWNAETEMFTNCDEANKLLHYEYRKPYKL